MWKNIIKGEKVHPSVKGFFDRKVSKIRQAMIEEKETIEEAEEFMQGEVYARYPEEIKERIERNLEEAKERIKKLGKMIGSEFSPQHDKFPMSVSQRLTPSTKKPKIERMDRPKAFSFNPKDTFDSNVMRRFNISEKEFSALSKERKDAFREAYKLLEGDK